MSVAGGREAGSDQRGNLMIVNQLLGDCCVTLFLGICSCAA